MNSFLTTKEFTKVLLACFGKYNLRRLSSDVKKHLSDENRVTLINSILARNPSPEFGKSDNYKLLLTPEYRNLIEKLANYKEHDLIKTSTSPIKILQSSYSDIFKVFIPHEFNGYGANYSNFAYLVESLRSNLSVSYSMIVNNLLCAQAIVKYGAENVKNKYLPQIASGELIGSFCLNESNCGNHFCMMTSNGEYSSKSKMLKLSGRKNWIYNADSMDFCILFVKTKINSTTDSLSAFLIDSPLKYFIKIQPTKNNLNISNVYDIEFDGVTIPAELLGNIGDGFKIATDLQNSARFSVAAACLAISKAALNEFSLNNDFSSSHINNLIVNWSSKLFGVETGLYFTANVIDNHPDSVFGIENASLKVHAVEVAYEIIFGCIEISKKYDNSNFYHNLLTKIQGLDLFLGSSDVLRLYVGGVIVQKICQENTDVIYKTLHKFDRKLSDIDFCGVFPPQVRNSLSKKQFQVFNTLMGTLRKNIIQAASLSLFNLPNEDFFIARVAKVIMLSYHIFCVFNRYQHLSTNELTDEDTRIIEICLNDLWNKTSSTIKEGSDVMSYSYNTVKYENLSELVFKSQIHGIEPAITRNW